MVAARQDALLSLRELAGEVPEDEVEFVTVSEGERGLMGVGRQPARVLARAQVAAVALGPVAERVRDVVERIASAIDPELTVTFNSGIAPCVEANTSSSLFKPTVRVAPKRSSSSCTIFSI